MTVLKQIVLLLQVEKGEESASRPLLALSGSHVPVSISLADPKFLL